MQLEAIKSVGSTYLIESSSITFDDINLYQRGEIPCVDDACKMEHDEGGKRLHRQCFYITGELQRDKFLLIGTFLKALGQPPKYTAQPHQSIIINIPNFTVEKTALESRVKNLIVLISGALFGPTTEFENKEKAKMLTTTVAAGAITNLIIQYEDDYSDLTLKVLNMHGKWSRAEAIANYMKMFNLT